MPIGGELLAAETPLEAAHRKLREATGLAGSFEPLPGAVDGAPPGLMAYEEHRSGGKGLHLNFCFRAAVSDDVVRPSHADDEWRWVDAADAPPCPPNIRRLLVQLTEPTPQQLVERWIATFNARDLDGLLALYSDAAVHHSPKLREQWPDTLGQISGKPALRAWWANSFARLGGLSYDTISITADRGQAVLEYWRRLPGSADLRVGEVFRCERGQIIESFVYHG